MKGVGKKNIFYIYALVDPNTLEFRYIGKTTNPEDRFYQHTLHCYKSNDGRPEDKSSWMQDLKDNKQIPIFVKLGETTDRQKASIMERQCIAQYFKSGSRLFNHENRKPPNFIEIGDLEKIAKGKGKKLQVHAFSEKALTKAEGGK